MELYKRKPNTKCLVCNKNIYKRPSEIEVQRNRVFCSRICFGISCRKEKPCTICRKPILSGLNKKTCSRACANINRVGIKYKIGRPNDNVVKLRVLKLRLFEIRGGKCQRCDYKKSRGLQVHHKNRDTNNNDLDNLELICPNCHCEEHYLEKSWLKY